MLPCGVCRGPLQSPDFLRPSEPRSRGVGAGLCRGAAKGPPAGALLEVARPCRSVWLVAVTRLAPCCRELRRKLGGQ